MHEPLRLLRTQLRCRLLAPVSCAWAAADTVCENQRHLPSISCEGLRHLLAGGSSCMLRWVAHHSVPHVVLMFGGDGRCSICSAVVVPSADAFVMQHHAYCVIPAAGVGLQLLTQNDVLYLAGSDEMQLGQRDCLRAARNAKQRHRFPSGTLLTEADTIARGNRSDLSSKPAATYGTALPSFRCI